MIQNCGLDEISSSDIHFHDVDLIHSSSFITIVTYVQLSSRALGELH